MQGLYQLNATITHFLEGFLETAVPMIAGLAEVVGLFIIIPAWPKPATTMCGRPFSTTTTTSIMK